MHPYLVIWRSGWNLFQNKKFIQRGGVPDTPTLEARGVSMDEMSMITEIFKKWATLIAIRLEDLDPNATHSPPDATTHSASSSAPLDTRSDSQEMKTSTTTQTPSTSSRATKSHLNTDTNDQGSLGTGQPFDATTDEAQTLLTVTLIPTTRDLQLAAHHTLQLTGDNSAAMLMPVMTTRRNPLHHR